MRNPFKRRRVAVAATDEPSAKALGSTAVRQVTYPTASVALVNETRSFNDLHRTVWAVQTVCGWLGRNLATYTPAVFDRRPGEHDRIRARDPLAALLNAPLPGVSKFELLRWLVSSAALSGSSYAVIVKSGAKVQSLVPVPSHLVSFESSQADGEQDSYVLNLPTGEKRVPRAGMLHVRLFDPTSIYGGQSPVEALRDLIAEDVAAGRDRRRFYTNSTRPYGVVERSLEAPPWSREAREAWRADWSAYLTGDGPAGADGGAFAVGLLEDGMKFSATDRISPRDASFVEGRDQVLRAVAAALGVPHQLIGAESENLSAAARLMEQTLSPYAALLEGAFDAQLVPLFFNGGNAANVFTKLLRPVTVTDAQAVESLSTAVRSGWLTPDEARGALGLPPIARGDSLREPRGEVRA